MKELKLKQVELKKQEREAIVEVASRLHTKITEDGDVLSILEGDNGKYQVVDYISRYEEQFFAFIYKAEELCYERDGRGEEHPSISKESKFCIGLITPPGARELIRKGYQVLSSSFATLEKDLAEGQKVIDL